MYKTGGNENEYKKCRKTRNEIEKENRGPNKRKYSE
jgi:hypothetical protein